MKGFALLVFLVGGLWLAMWVADTYGSSWGVLIGCWVGMMRIALEGFPRRDTP